MAASAAAAQIANLPPGAVVQPLPDPDSGAELRDHLTTLAQNPRSISALVGAGRAALALNDVEAAIAFFARADEIAPRDARVKAGMASSLVRMEQGQAALRYFAEALALGAPEIEIASDRGLAFDLAGNPARAQQDYAMVLRTREEAETRRRMALSLAVSGEREAALRMIEPQLARQDRAAWRVRALILALTGDSSGAFEAARVTMPPGTAQAMAPFLARLSSLDPAQKAAAVHFGRFPSDGGASRMATAPDTSAYPGAVALAEGRAVEAGAAGLRLRNPPPPAASTAARRRPGAAEQPSVTTAAQPSAQPPAPVEQVPPAPPPAAPATVQADPEPAEERDFQEVAALVSALPAERPARRLAERATRTEQPAPRAAHPARHWVQIAGGANRSALPREFARLAALAPELLRGRTAYMTPLRFTNRLLVGPFESEGAAQAFVNQLAAKDVAAFAWTSPAGQEIERLTDRQ